MRTKIAFAVLFTAWFWPQAQAQGDRPPYPPPPPPLFDQPRLWRDPQPQRPLNHPVKIEPTRPKERGSTKPGDWRGTVEEQKLRKETQTQKRKSAGKRQKTKKAAAVTSSTSAERRPRPNLHRPLQQERRPSPNEPRIEGSKGQCAGTKSTAIDTKAAQHENDLSSISTEAATNPAVFAFRNCISSYSAREVGKDIAGTWADLLIRATEGECRAQFDNMAQKLSRRFGERRVELVMQQLIETTLCLPLRLPPAASPMLKLCQFHHNRSSYVTGVFHPRNRGRRGTGTNPRLIPGAGQWDPIS